MKVTYGIRVIGLLTYPVNMTLGWK
jgi:hypothetical protein